MPRCRSCGVDKSQDSFYYRKDSGSYRPECKTCLIDRHTCNRLGITKEDLYRLEFRAGGKCECCGTSLRSSRYTRMMVDHDHSTGAVRGMLCHPCNTAIGLMDDDPVRLRQAAEYLESHSRKGHHKE